MKRRGGTLRWLGREVERDIVRAEAQVNRELAAQEVRGVLVKATIKKKVCLLWHPVDDGLPMAERTCFYCGKGPEAHS